MKINPGMIFLVWAVVCFTFKSQEIKNLTLAKLEVRNYYESGRYEQDLKGVIELGLKALGRLKAEPKDLVVFDVDETLLSNYDEIVSMDFGYRPDIWDEWILSARAPAILQVKKMYDSVLTMGFRIAIITGRDTRHRESTEKNLINAGYLSYDTLIVREIKQKSLKMAKFKEQSRLSLENAGYRVVMSVGDQDTDLEGKAVGIKVKLPDLLYLID